MKEQEITFVPIFNPFEDECKDERILHEVIDLILGKIDIESLSNDT